MTTSLTNADKFSITMPPSTHFRPVSCADIGCKHYVMGWVTTIDVSTQLGQAQADYIRHKSERSFVECQVSDSLVEFRFFPGQRCFREHKQRAHEVPPIFSVTAGGQRQVYREVERWQNDFNETMEKQRR